MDIPHLSLNLPVALLSRGLLLQLSAEFPRLKFGLVLDGTSQPTVSQLQQARIVYDILRASRTEDNEFSLKLVLRGKALEDFCRTGAQEDLQFVLERTPGAFYDALQLDLPNAPVFMDPKLVFEALANLSFPTIFQVTPAHSGFYDILRDLKSVFTIPVQPLPAIVTDLDPVSAPYEHAPNGYAVDLNATTTVQFDYILEALADKFDQPDAFVWLDLAWSGSTPESEDVLGAIRPYYEAAQAYFQQV